MIFNKLPVSVVAFEPAVVAAAADSWVEEAALEHTESGSAEAAAAVGASAVAGY